ncbi:MAG: hypothetical protein KDC91_06545 [Flavobacteriaceae bacterium]|nr:hypothetical protein [Flavobacteriaceae bacterium]
MKYSLLTKEQLEELHPEFSNFLATQSIDKAEWDNIKKEQPEVAQQELEVFSDLVWEGVINKVTYLENQSPQQLFLFKIAASEMQLIMVSLQNTTINLTTVEGMLWLEQNLHSEKVELFTSQKAYSEDKNLDVFNLIQQGAIITKGELFEGIAKVING